jgi:hypothetical protein
MSLSTNNISLAIKYIFLNFAQSYFEKATNRYIWSANPVTSGIIIADKFSVDLGIAAKRPAILLSRGAAGWTNSVRGQYGFLNPHRTGTMKFGTLIPAITDDRVRAQEITDLYSGSVTYNVVSKQGVETEDIANKLFCAVTAHKQDFQSIGIFKFNSISISEERILRYRADFELVGISIDISFLMQHSLAASDSLYNCRCWLDDDEQFEGIHYDVINNGTQIEFYVAPETGQIVTLTYVDAVTLITPEQVVIGTGDGTTTVFTIPNGGAVYGYYKIFEGMLVTLTNTDDDSEQEVQVGEI